MEARWAGYNQLNARGTVVAIGEQEEGLVISVDEKTEGTVEKLVNESIKCVITVPDGAEAIRIFTGDEYEYFTSDDFEEDELLFFTEKDEAGKFLFFASAYYGDPVEDPEEIEEWSELLSNLVTVVVTSEGKSESPDIQLVKNEVARGAWMTFEVDELKDEESLRLCVLDEDMEQVGDDYEISRSNFVNWIPTAALEPGEYRLAAWIVEPGKEASDWVYRAFTIIEGEPLFQMDLPEKLLEGTDVRVAVYAPDATRVQVIRKSSEGEEETVTMFEMLDDGYAEAKVQFPEGSFTVYAVAEYEDEKQEIGSYDITAYGQDKLGIPATTTPKLIRSTDETVSVTFEAVENAEKYCITLALIDGSYKKTLEVTEPGTYTLELEHEKMTTGQFCFLYVEASADGYRPSYFNRDWPFIPYVDPSKVLSLQENGNLEVGEEAFARIDAEILVVPGGTTVAPGAFASNDKIKVIVTPDTSWIQEGVFSEGAGYIFMNELP